MIPVLLVTHLLLGQPATAAQCTDWNTCRDLAQAAAARQDYETFHDLAWRTMQLRRTNDPDVMYMLARAQTLSGRPDDALVMLGRIADMGVATDADTNPDFARVRTLPGWPEFKRRIDQLRAGEQAVEPTTRVASEKTETASEREASPASAKRGAGSVDTVAEFKTPQFSPGGIAYDAVSRRYLVGNLPERKLTEIEEGSNRPATLAGAAAQFFDVKALEIDTRQGDLWVVSNEGANGDASASAVHKLQLISGRVLKVFETPAAELPTRFVDVAVSPSGVVLVLDAAKPRIFAIAPTGPLHVTIPLPEGSPVSIAPVSGGRTVYVAYADRLVRVDMKQRTVAPVKDAQGRLIGGLQRIRWHGDSLVGVQSVGDGMRRIVQLHLKRGAHAPQPEVLDQWREPSGGVASASLIGEDFYYLVPGDGESVIRRVRLRSESRPRD
jgi:hypothetical protein